MFGFKKTKPQAFADVLDQIRPSETDADTEMAAPIAPSQAHQPHDWLLQMLSGLAPSGHGERAQATPPVFEASYLEDAVEPLLEAIASCEQDAIAEELGLSENLSANDLKKLRRAFARANHPDRLAPSQREIATHRMTIANMLIDRELQQKMVAK
ncbi:hypothetical protein [Methyloferula stellata]|uniref:hypothetical protein n=1 Tax=Methyloferula stellata TaxID=876270 RepID=UPI00035E3750|nr:hypothetical protein [Methyloferula stellata]